MGTEGFEPSSDGLEPTILARMYPHCFSANWLILRPRFECLMKFKADKKVLTCPKAR